MKMFGISLPRGLRGWTSLIYKVVLLASVLPVLDGLQAIGRGNSDMLLGLATLAFGLVLVLAGIAGYIFQVGKRADPITGVNGVIYSKKAPASAGTDNRGAGKNTTPTT